jgi:hypothetical protein
MKLTDSRVSSGLFGTPIAWVVIGLVNLVLAWIGSVIMQREMISDGQFGLAFTIQL